MDTRYYSDDAGNLLAWEGPGWYVDLPQSNQHPELDMHVLLDNRPGPPPGDWVKYHNVVWREGTDGFPKIL